MKISRADHSLCFRCLCGHGTWAKGELVDLIYPDDPPVKVAEFCSISGLAGDPFHGMRVARTMVKVNVGRILVPDCPLFVPVEEDMPPQRTLFDVKRGVTVWPGAYVRHHEPSSP